MMTNKQNERHIIPKRLYEIKDMLDMYRIMPFEEKNVYTFSVKSDSGFIDYRIEENMLFYTIIQQYIDYSLNKGLKLFELFDVNTLIIVPYNLANKLNFVEEYCGIKIHYSKYLQYICDKEFQALGIRYDRFEITSDKYYLAKYSKNDIKEN